MLAFYSRTAGKENLRTVKNEAMESCPESITTTGRTNFLASWCRAQKKDLKRSLSRPGTSEHKIEQNFYAPQIMYHCKSFQQIIDALYY